MDQSVLLSVILGGAAVAATLYYVWRWINDQGRFFEPRHEPRMHEAYARKGHLEGLEKRVDKLETHWDARRGEIYKMINENARQISGLSTQQEMTYQMLLRIEAKVDVLAENKQDKRRSN